MPTEEASTPLSFFSSMLAFLRKIILLLLPFFSVEQGGHIISGLGLTENEE
ncbi:MAG: hypothetical protein ACI4GA_01075 [Acutalibacteraceae bacterium]